MVSSMELVVSKWKVVVVVSIYKQNMLFVHVFSNDTVNVLSDGNVVAGVENIISSRLGPC